MPYPTDDRSRAPLSGALTLTRFVLAMALLLLLAGPTALIVMALTQMDPADVPVTVYPALGLLVAAGGWALSVMSGSGNRGRATRRRA